MAELNAPDRIRLSHDWWRGAVIYQIYPRSFCDSNGDGVGDLPGITSRLSYVADLGVDAIWISPFFASPMKDFGYDVSDYCAVDPLFGSLADFDALVQRAHLLGLKVIIDQVWGHTSDQHSWFAESRSSRHNPRADWYVWADPNPDGTPPNNWLAVFGGSAWTWDPRRRQYYLHHFLDAQPKLNLRNPEVKAALFETAQFWLDRGVDGFRLDAVDFFFHDEALRNNPAAPPLDGQIPAKPFGLQQHVYDVLQPDVCDFLAEIRRFMDQYPGTVTLAEVSSQAGAYQRIDLYSGCDNQHLHMAYTLRLLKRDFSPGVLIEALKAVQDSMHDGWACWMFSNHDVERSSSRWSGGNASPEFARLLASLLVSLRGSLCIYQGEELGLPEAEIPLEHMQDPYGIAFYPEFKGRDGSRTPMPWHATDDNAGFTNGRPWLPIPDEHRWRAVDRQERDSRSVLNVWRSLLAWRKRHRALMTGAIKLLDLPAPLIGFERGEGDDAIVCVFNLSDQDVQLPASLALQMAPLAPHAIGDEVNGAAVLPRHGVYFGSSTTPWDLPIRFPVRERVVAELQRGGWIGQLA